MEFTAIYGGGPLAILAIRRAGILFVALWLGAVIAWLGTRRREPPPRHEQRAERLGSCPDQRASDAIRAGVPAGLGIGLFTKASLAGELSQGDVITVIDDFVRGVRDISLVWPRRRFIPARVQRVTDFFAKAIPERV